LIISSLPVGKCQFSRIGKPLSLGSQKRKKRILLELWKNGDLIPFEIPSSIKFGKYFGISLLEGKKQNNFKHKCQEID